MNKKLFSAAIAISAIATTGMFAFAEGDTADGGTQAKGKAIWHDVDSGFALAKKENKPILTDFTTDWCGWCKKMERDTFDNKAVQKVMDPNFILVRANAEDHGSGQRLAHQNKINGYPTLIIFSADGQPKATLVGYKSPAQFIPKLNDFLAGRPISEDE